MLRPYEDGSRKLAIVMHKEISAASHQLSVTNHFSQLKEIFGDRLYIEVQRLSPGDGRTLRESGTPRPRNLACRWWRQTMFIFCDPKEHLHHRAGECHPHRRIADDSGAARKSPLVKHGSSLQQKCKNLFPIIRSCCKQRWEIADRCNLKLELGKLIFPECAVPEGETPDSYLEKVSFDGALKRYPSVTPEVRSRLIRELEVIRKMEPVTLFSARIGHRGRKRGGAAFPRWARGSAASSMVTYCLGISRVCPLRWGSLLRTVF